MFKVNNKITATIPTLPGGILFLVKLQSLSATLSEKNSAMDYWNRCGDSLLILEIKGGTFGKQL